MTSAYIQDLIKKLEREGNISVGVT